MVPKLNYALMIVLCLGLLAGVTALAVTFSGDRRPAEISHDQIDALINRLASDDPEVVSRTRHALVALGPRALPQLEEAVSSDRREIAEHAAALIEVIRGQGDALPVEP